MHRAALIAGLGLLCALSPAGAADSVWGWRLGGGYNAPNRDGLFYLGPSRYENLAEAFVTYADKGFYFYGTAYRQQQDGFDSVQKGIVNELYVDTRIGDWDVTAGKKRLGWGVGFGFRPLDVIQPEPRRALIPPAPEGLPMLVAEKFSATNAVSVLCGNDFRTGTGRVESGGTECAARYFSTDGGLDVEVLAHTSETVDYETGADVAWVANEQLETHAALLYQRRYRKWINTLTERRGVLLSATDPMEYREHEHGLKALAGATYTGSNGHSFMAEAWYDRAGYRREEWRRLRALTRAQRRLLETGMAPAAAVQGNIAFSLQAFGSPNPMQRNLLLRWSYDADTVDPAFDVLVTPDDGGVVATLSATHTLGAAHTLNYGLRYYGGADSMVGALPATYVVYAVIKSAFNW